jgi:WD40 repeat protein
MRSDYNQVSLIKLQATKSIGYSLESTRGEGSCLSWTRCGRFLARTHGNDFIIVDASKDFEEVQKYTHSHPVHNLKFCQSQNKRDYLAVVCHDGFLNVYSLRKSVGNVHIEEVASIHLELNICAVSWSGDGKIIIVGSKQMNLHFISSETFRPIRDPVRTGGRVRTIDCVSEDTFDDVGEYAAPYGIAITTGQNCSNMYDLRTFETTLEVSRSRTIRCLRYHPSLPILAIGDGGNEVMIVDLVGERKMAQFSVQGRVNSIDFSPIGDYIVVASDDCSFTIHETNTFKVVQEIPSRGFAMSVAFSGTSGQYLALCHASGETEIIKMGALLSIDYIPIGNNFLATEFPQWVYEEAIYRSPEGPSFLQRCMLYGTKESLVCAAVVLKNSPEAVLTFDRTTGVGCFETAVELRKPNIMKLIMGTLVDGTLDTRTDGSSSILTTTMPVDGLLTLRDLILHHPPGYATDILKQMTFVKVPFTTPRKCRINDLKVITHIFLKLIMCS